MCPPTTSRRCIVHRLEPRGYICIVVVPKRPTRRLPGRTAPLQRVGQNLHPVIPEPRSLFRKFMAAFTQQLSKIEESLVGKRSSPRIENL